MSIWMQLGACLLLGAMSVGAAPIEDNNTWVQASITGPLGESQRGENRWLYSVESVNRFGDDSRRLAQSVWRAGLGYALNAQWSVWAGLSHTHTDTPYATTPYHEHRAFQQIQWHARVGEFTLSTRHRLEERFLETGDDTGLRLRHQFRLSHPLRLVKPLSWVVWEEVFLNLNATDYGAKRGVDQNRVFAGFGWKWSESARSEAGYLHHFNDRPGREDRINHVVAVSLALAFK